MRGREDAAIECRSGAWHILRVAKDHAEFLQSSGANSEKRARADAEIEYQKGTSVKFHGDNDHAICARICGSNCEMLLSEAAEIDSLKGSSEILRLALAQAMFKRLILRLSDRVRID